MVLSWHSSVGWVFAHGVRGLPFESHQCLPKYVEEISSVAMLAAKRSTGVAPQVNLVECVTHMYLPSANKAKPNLALKLRGDIIRSPKQRYQWPHKQDPCPPNFFFKRKTISSNYIFHCWHSDQFPYQILLLCDGSFTAKLSQCWKNTLR